MIILRCDNGIERGQLLRVQRPKPRVDMRSLLPRDKWPDMYRQDGIAELLGGAADVIDVDKPDAVDCLGGSAESGTPGIVVDHEAMHPSLSAFWEASVTKRVILETLASGGVLWVGFQSTNYLPAWLALILPAGGLERVAIGDADAFRPLTGHRLTKGLPDTVDFICDRSWRALRDMPCTEPLDLSVQPSERGSLAWLRLGEAWQSLAHRVDHPELSALASATIGGGTVILDQTLAMFGANIDSATARQFAANTRHFLGIEPNSSGCAQGSASSRWRSLRGKHPPVHTDGELVDTAGIPFAVHGDESLLAYTGDTAELPVGGQVKCIHMLGSILSYPMATGAWFVDAMDFSQDLFVGDTVGRIVIEYSDGSTDTVPLVVGWTVFWQPDMLGLGRTPMKPFDDPGARKILFDTMQLAPGTGEGVRSWVLSLAPRPKPIERLLIEGDPERPGVPVYGAVTVETGEDIGEPLPPVRSAAMNTANSTQVLTAPFELSPDHLEPLQRLLYTFPEDFASANLELPVSFDGANVTFGGPREAAAWTCIYAHNMASMHERQHPAGGVTLNSGRVYGAYRKSLGTWQDGRCDLTGPASFWSRDNGRAGIERLALGLHTGADKELELWDRLLYAAHPPHTRRSAREMQGPAQWHRETLNGNCVHIAPENDGHGMLMLYHAAYLRHYPEQFDKLWPAMIDYAEWICFLLDNPLDPDQPPDTIYTDSECSGFGHWDIYSNWLCLAGLQAYTDIARRQGYTHQAERWGTAAARLKQGISNGLVDTEGGREIWHASPFSQWQSLTEALTPLFSMPDLHSYDCADMDNADLVICRDTYARLVGHPHYHLRTRMIGYDHALLLQAALLLDDEPRSTKLLETLARAIYDTHAEETWIVAEGAVIPTHEKFWHRLGMGANTIHVAETLKVVRLLIGLDDLTPGRLKIMPRLPMNWNNLSVQDYPLAGGSVAGYDYRRDPHRASLQLRLTRDSLVDIRLGPFEALPKGCLVNGQSWSLESLETPSGYWGWLRELNGNTWTIHMEQD